MNELLFGNALSFYDRFRILHENVNLEYLFGDIFILRKPEYYLLFKFQFGNFDSELNY